MSRTSRRPGPTGTSCLTCKQRHKKCDQRQPTCERCETRDLECLGYSHIQRAQSVAHVRSMRRLLPKPAEAEYSTSHFESDGRDSRSTLSNDSLPQIAPSKATSTTLSTISSTSDLNTSSKATVAETSASILRRIIDLYSRLPYSNLDPLKELLNGQCFVDIFIARTERVMAHWYFQPTNFQKDHFRQNSVQRLRNSKFNRWISLVGMSITESVLQGDTPQSRLHTTWIEHIEGSLKHELALDLAPREMRDRRTGWVHVRFCSLFPCWLLI
ncbi:hypothetical protein B0J17DRAFT_411410 [Rhizoctonia solani]|nr:hypothetical protein B0J17DRAFT_411410 [Rhizoctonia solani]